MNNIELKNIVYKLEKQTSSSFAASKKFLSVLAEEVPYNIDCQISTHRYFLDFTVDSEDQGDDALNIVVRNAFPRNMSNVAGTVTSDRTVKISRISVVENGKTYHQYYLTNMTLTNIASGLFEESDFVQGVDGSGPEGYVSIKYSLNYGDSITVGLSDKAVNHSSNETIKSVLEKEYPGAKYFEKEMDFKFKQISGVVFSNSVTAERDDGIVQFTPAEPEYGHGYNLISSDNTMSKGLVKSNILVGRNADGHDIIRVKNPEAIDDQNNLTQIGEYGGGIEFTEDSIRFIFR